MSAGDPHMLGDPPEPGWAQIRVETGEHGPMVKVDACDSEGARRTYALDWCDGFAVEAGNAESSIQVTVLGTAIELARLPVAAVRIVGQPTLADQVRALVREEIEALKAEERRAHPLRMASAEDFPPADAEHFPALHRALGDAAPLLDGDVAESVRAMLDAFDGAGIALSPAGAAHYRALRKVVGP